MLKTYYLPLCIAILLLVGLGGFLFRPVAPSSFSTPSLFKPFPLPAFTLPSLTEKNAYVTHTSILHPDRYSLINIFASWCAACRIEHPFLMELAKDKNIALYGINWKDTRANAENLLQTAGDPYKAVGWDYEGKTVIDLGITGAPETLLVSPEGFIIYRYPGPLTPDVFTTFFLPLMEPHNE